MITVLAYDVGTSGVKTCLFEIDDRIRIIDSVSASYSLHVLPDGGAEQILTNGGRQSFRPPDRLPATILSSAQH